MCLYLNKYKMVTKGTHKLLSPIIAPSILAADFANLEYDCKRVLDSGADWLHIDIMDGNFVPNIAVGFPVISSLRKKLPDTFFDCHCMISDPMKYVETLCQCGGSQMTFHVESNIDDMEKLIEKIKEQKMKVGLAIKPKTLLDHTITKYLDKNLIDMFLVMTVEPGFGGQSFMPECLSKVEELRKNYPYLDIQVDGGIKLSNIDQCTEKGANVIVSGTGIYNTPDFKTTISDMKSSVRKYCCRDI